MVWAVINWAISALKPISIPPCMAARIKRSAKAIPHDPSTVAAALRAFEPWYEPAVHRLETVQRARLWRYLTGDDTFDVDWYLTRTERRLALRAPEEDSA